MSLKRRGGNSMASPRRFIVIAIVIVSVIAVFATNAVIGAESPTPSPLTGVQPASLRAAGVKLEPPPPGDAPATGFSVNEARAGALKRDPGAKILDAALLQFTDLNAVPNFACLCWVVATEPTNGIYLSGPVRVDANGKAVAAPKQVAENPVHLDIFDRSGKFIMAVEGATGVHDE